MIEIQSKRVYVSISRLLGRELVENREMRLSERSIHTTSNSSTITSVQRQINEFKTYEFVK